MFDPSLFLLALAMVESGNLDSAVGQAGERSRYQITQAVWRETMPGQSFTLCQGDLADQAARRHLNRALIALRDGGHLLVTPHRLAYCWNRGIRRGVKVSNSTLARDDYANRVANLYYDLERRTAKPLQHPLPD